MALVAGESWCWYLDGQGSLAIELGDGWCFRTPFSRRQLIPYFINRQRQMMSVTQAGIYQEYCHLLHEQMPALSDAQVTQIALNATALRFLLRMEANRSWLFQHAEQPVQEFVGHTQCLDGSLAQVQTPQDDALVFIVQADNQAACALLLDTLIVPGKPRPIPMFSALRVNLDRLNVYTPVTDNISYLPLRAVG